MAEHHWEIERKYDIAPERSAKIKLDRVKGFTVGEPTVHEMSASYYDTEDLDLSRADVAVRRRTGGGDDGWHVKYRAGAARGEVHHAPLRTSERMPAALRKTLVGLTLGRSLSRVATIRTQRHEYPVFDPEGEQHAVVCVDAVSARDERTGEDRAWSECEIELSSDELSKKQTKAVFAALEEVLFAAGAVASSSPAKIARALGQVEAPTDPSGADAAAASKGEKKKPGKNKRRDAEPGTGQDRSGESTGADVLARMCEEQFRELQHWDFAVRIGATDAVHQLRVHSRALRSVLHAARAFVPEQVGADLEERLKLLARTLGDARDQEVATQQLRDRLDSGYGLITDEARNELLEVAAARSVSAARAVRRVMDDPAHVQLLSDVASLSRQRPFTADAQQLSAKKFAKEVLGTALRDVVSVAAAEPSHDPEGGRADVSELGWEVSGRLANEDERLALAARFDHLHDARKAVKAVRYVTESLERAGATAGRKRSRAAVHAKAYQDQLGALTDSAVMEDWLAHAAVALRRAGKDRYAVGVLHGMELASLQRHLAEAPGVLEDLVADLKRELPDED